MKKEKRIKKIRKIKKNEKLPLTKKQIEVLDFIKKYINKNGYSPSIREICVGMNVTSSATVHSHISNLLEKGWLKKTNNKFRTIEIIGDNEYYNQKNKIVNLPLITDVDHLNDTKNNEKVFISTKLFDISNDSILLKNNDDILIIRQMKSYSKNDKIVVINNNKIIIKIYDKNDKNIYGKISGIIKYEKIS